MTDSTADNNSEFFAEFLDEYYAECDEHLTLLRSNLLALETRVGQPHLDRALLDEIFRSFHTIKGVSGMVGLSAAEELAHQMESYLRDLRQGDVVLSLSGIEALISGLAMLEQVINARRNESPLPKIDQVMFQLQAVVLSDSATLVSGAAEAGASSTPDDVPGKQAGDDKARTWRVKSCRLRSSLREV